MNAPGKSILRIVSILYIVFGGIFALMMLLSLFFSAGLATLVEGMLGTLGTWIGGLLFVAFLIPAAVDLIIGILGVKYADEPSKTSFFIVIGIILSVLTLISLISSFTVWSLIMLVMPVLYIVGGYMNKNVLRAER